MLRIWVFLGIVLLSPSVFTFPSDIELHASHNSNEFNDTLSDNEEHKLPPVVIQDSINNTKVTYNVSGPSDSVMLTNEIYSEPVVIHIPKNMKENNIKPSVSQDGIEPLINLQKLSSAVQSRNDENKLEPASAQNITEPSPDSELENNSTTSDSQPNNFKSSFVQSEIKTSSNALNDSNVLSNPVQSDNNENKIEHKIISNVIDSKPVSDASSNSERLDNEKIILNSADDQGVIDPLLILKGWFNDTAPISDDDKLERKSAQNVPEQSHDLETLNNSTKSDVERSESSSDNVKNTLEYTTSQDIIEPSSSLQGSLDSINPDIARNNSQPTVIQDKIESRPTLEESSHPTIPESKKNNSTTKVTQMITESQSVSNGLSDISVDGDEKNLKPTVIQNETQSSSNFTVNSKDSSTIPKANISETKLESTIFQDISKSQSNTTGSDFPRQDNEENILRFKVNDEEIEIQTNSEESPESSRFIEHDFTKNKLQPTAVQNVTEFPIDLKVSNNFTKSDNNMSSTDSKESAINVTTNNNKNESKPMIFYIMSEPSIDWDEVSNIYVPSKIPLYLRTNKSLDATTSPVIVNKIERGFFQYAIDHTKILINQVCSDNIATSPMAQVLLLSVFANRAVLKEKIIYSRKLHLSVNDFNLMSGINSGAAHAIKPFLIEKSNLLPFTKPMWILAHQPALKKKNGEMYWRNLLKEMGIKNYHEHLYAKIPFSFGTYEFRFKEKWSHFPHECSDIAEGKFQLSPNTEKRTVFTTLYGKYRGGKINRLNAEFIEIPYKEFNGDEMTIVFLRPHQKISDIRKFIGSKSFSSLKYEDFMGGSIRDVKVSVPSITINPCLDWKAPLELPRGREFSRVDITPNIFIEIASPLHSINFCGQKKLNEFGGSTFMINRPSVMFIMWKKMILVSAIVDSPKDIREIFESSIINYI